MALNDTERTTVDMFNQSIIFTHLIIQLPRRFFFNKIKLYKAKHHVTKFVNGILFFGVFFA